MEIVDQHYSNVELVAKNTVFDQDPSILKNN